MRTGWGAGLASVLVLLATGCTGADEPLNDGDAVAACRAAFRTSTPPDDVRSTVSPAGVDRYRVRLWGDTPDHLNAPQDAPNAECFASIAGETATVERIVHVRPER